MSKIPNPIPEDAKRPPAPPAPPESKTTQVSEEIHNFHKTEGYSHAPIVTIRSKTEKEKFIDELSDIEGRLLFQDFTAAADVVRASILVLENS